MQCYDTTDELCAFFNFNTDHGSQKTADDDIEKKGGEEVGGGRGRKE
jgi:hypothetical protein